MDFELILVANYDSGGKPDKTPAIVKQLAARDPRCRFIAVPKEGMMGWDLRAGLAAARGRRIAFLDGDGQTPASEVVQLIEYASRNPADICMIYRALRHDSLWRRFLSTIFNLVTRLLFPGTGIRDINAKPKLITRQAYEKIHLRSDDWFADVELILKARRLGMSIREIPGSFLKNSWRKSFIGPAAIMEFLKNLLKFRLRYWFKPDSVD